MTPKRIIWRHIGNWVAKSKTIHKPYARIEGHRYCCLHKLAYIIIGCAMAFISANPLPPKAPSTLATTVANFGD